MQLLRVESVAGYRPAPRRLRRGQHRRRSERPVHRLRRGGRRLRSRSRKPRSSSGAGGCCAATTAATPGPPRRSGGSCPATSASASAPSGWPSIRPIPSGCYSGPSGRGSGRPPTAAARGAGRTRGRARGAFDDPAVQQAGVNIVTFGPPADDGGARLYAGVANVGVLVSEDRGATWEQVADLAAGERAVEPDLRGRRPAAVDRTPSSGARGRLLRLEPGDDGADGSHHAGAGRSAGYVAADPPTRLAWSSPTTPCATATSGPRTDEGQSWQDHAIEIDPAQVPWLQATDLDSFMSVGRFVFDPDVPGRLWFAEGMGVWRTDDIDADTVTWTSEAVRHRGGGRLHGHRAARRRTDRHRRRSPGLPARWRRRLPRGAARSTSASPVGRASTSAAGDPEVGWPGWAPSPTSDSGPAPRPAGAVSTDGGTTWREMEGLDPDMFGGEVAVSATDPDAARVAAHPLSSTRTSSRTRRSGSTCPATAAASWDHVSSPTATSTRSTGSSGGSPAGPWPPTGSTATSTSCPTRSGSTSAATGRRPGTGRPTPRRAPIRWTATSSARCRPSPAPPGHLWASLGKGGLYRTDDAGASPWVAVPGHRRGPGLRVRRAHRRLDGAHGLRARAGDGRGRPRDLAFDRCRRQLVRCVPVPLRPRRGHQRPRW